MKKLLIILAGLIVVIFLALIFVPKLINWNNYKPKMASMVKEATGRELRIDGNIELSIFPHLMFSVSDVHLANAPGMNASEMLSLGAVSGKLRLLPLLMRRVVVDSFIVQEPSVHLEVDNNGRANWEFDTSSAASTGEGEEPSGGKTALPIKGLVLGDVRVSRGNLSLINAVSGQTIVAKDIDLMAALANLSSPLTLSLRMMLNDEPVQGDFTLDSPRGILQGSTVSLQTAVTSKYLTTDYRGKLQQQPVPGLDGTFNLDIPSVGQLAAWLGRPLDRTQPDPGPLKVRAVFQGDGKTVALTEATIAGEALNAKATGRFDGSGEITRITLNVESDKLNVDQYLPPPTTPTTTKTKKIQPGKGPSTPFGEIMAMFSTEPIDLSVLQNLEADVRIAIGGIKAMGYDIGQVLFTTDVKKGVLTATVDKLALYSGTLNGRLQLDASGTSLDVNASLTIDRINVGKLAKVATGGEVRVTGIASGNLHATANGESPKRLVESLKGAMTFDLGGVDVTKAPAGAITALKVALDLPGIEQAPSFKGHVVYNQQPVTVSVSTDPLRSVLSSDVFALKASVDSALVRLGYDGKVQQRPIPGLDGAFDLDIPSVGKLASWMGQPLDKSQPDPGPLKAHLVFKGHGATIALETATLEGQDLKATASGSYDGSGDIARVALKVDTGSLDLDRYLPAPSTHQGKPPRDAKPAPRPGDPLALMSDTPFALGALQKMAAEVEIAISGIRLKGYRIGRTALSTTLTNGLLTTDLRELNLYNGNLKGIFKVDGSGKKLGLNAVLTVAGVNVDELVKTAAGGTGTARGTASGNLNLNAQGVSPKALLDSLSGTVVFNLDGLEIKEASAVSELHLELNLPGLSKPSGLKGRVVYNKEPVQLDLELNSIRKALAGNPFATNLAVKSKVLNLVYAGKLQQQPGPGLDGTLDLDIPSVGRLAVWLEQPLPKEQPDPGPVTLRAVFEANASQATLKEATLSGKALQVKASGSVDQRGSVPVLAAKVQVENADLNAYFPPSETSKTPPARKTAEGQPKATGWSDEPLDLSALSMANGAIDIKIDTLRYRDLTIKPGHMKVRLKSGVLDALLNPLQTSDGQIDSAVHLDASSKVAGLNYQLTIAGLDARPLLKTLVNNDRLSGKTEFQLKVRSKGKSQRELIRSLNGNGQFKFFDGAIHGINLAAILRQARTLGLDQQAVKDQKTDFAELSGSFVILNGVLENKDLKMLAPLVRLSGTGLVPMPEQTIDYDITARLVASLEGQGGKDAMAGVPIPIKIKGPWENITYIVDWKKVFEEMASDPERLKNLPQDLRETSKNLGIDLPLPKSPITGKGTSPLGQLEQLQKQLPQEPAAPTPVTKTPRAVPRRGTKRTKKNQVPTPADPLKIPQDLFKR